MGEEDGLKGGGTGQIGPNPSTDTTACQTPNQPDIPAWMVARNNSVHAPVFGQPSARKSRKLLSTSVSVPKADTTRSPVVQSQARDMAIETQVAPLPLNPSPSVELDTLNDDQALALLLKNETIAGLLQDAFNTRVLEYQQKLHREYERRLAELEDYTRSWRDTTKELWSALSEGTVKPNNDQREVLLWNGPQDAGLDFNPELPTAPQEIVEEEVDSNGRVACISIKHSRPSHSVSKVVCQSWIKDKQARGSFSPLGTESGCERPTSPERSKPPYAWLFQRTIALSNGLKKLNSSTSRESPNFQHKHQGLAMGGEPREVRSPSPTEQKTPVISRRLAHGGKMGIPPIGFTNQENGEIATENGGSSDLIMFDGEPMSFTAPQREKHSLSPFNREDSTAKRFRVSSSDGTLGHVGQLPQEVSHGSAHQILPAPGPEPPMPASVITQKHHNRLRADLKQSQDSLEHRTENNTHFKVVPEKIMRQDGEIDLFEPNLQAFLARGSKEASITNESKHQVFPSPVLRAQSLPLGNQDPVKTVNTMPPSSAITARGILELRQQIRQLENHLQDKVDRADQKIVGGKIEEIERLRINIEHFEGVLEAQLDTEKRQTVSQNPGTKLGVSSPDVSRCPKASSNYSSPFLAEQEGATFGQETFTGQSKSTPMFGIQHFSYVNDIPAIEASPAPKPSTRTISTWPKALVWVPTEPRAMRMSMPSLQTTCWWQLAGPRAISIDPSTENLASQVESSSDSTPRGSLGRPNQVDAGNGLVRVDSTGVQSKIDRQQPLEAVVSPPPPSHGDEHR